MSLAIQRFDRTNALHTRTVTIDNLMVVHVPPMTCVAGLLNGTFDAAEIPLAYYVFLRDQGASLTAIPVFTDRIFVQEYVYTRPDSGISSLGELRGRRVGIPRYYITAGLWHRGMLKEEYGISPYEIEWHTTSPEIDSRMQLPDDVKVVIDPGPYLGLKLLLDGKVDCLMTEATPIIPEDRQRNVVHVHRHVQELKRDYFQRTAFHPIVHVIALGEAAAQDRPQLVEELCHAFDKAKMSAYQLLQNERTTALPLMRDYLDETAEMFGDDPWPYGLSGRNRAELERLLGYAHDQGLTRRRLGVESLFAASVRSFPFRAKMIRGANLAGLGSLLGQLPKEDSPARDSAPSESSAPPKKF
jgi:4,5-dihydroxyphthalate decarboxylase